MPYFKHRSTFEVPLLKLMNDSNKDKISFFFKRKKKKELLRGMGLLIWPKNTLLYFTNRKYHDNELKAKRHAELIFNSLEFHYLENKNLGLGHCPKKESFFFNLLRNYACDVIGERNPLQNIKGWRYYPKESSSSSTYSSKTDSNKKGNLFP